MPTLVRDPQPPELEALLQRRQRLGQNVLDEVWDGVYVMRQVPGVWHAQVGHQLAVIFDPLAREAGLVPLSSFNLGAADDYRVPDAGPVVWSRSGPPVRAHRPAGGRDPLTGATGPGTSSPSTPHTTSTNY